MRATCGGDRDTSVTSHTSHTSVTSHPQPPWAVRNRREPSFDTLALGHRTRHQHRTQRISAGFEEARMRTFNATLSMLSVVALAFGNGIYIMTTARCTGLVCLRNDGGAALFIGGGIVLGVLPWLLSLLRWLFGGPGGGVPGVLPFAPLLPAGVFLLATETSLRPYFVDHLTVLITLVLLSLLLTPLLTLFYNIGWLTVE
jgi:hypothetical protein